MAEACPISSPRTCTRIDVPFMRSEISPARGPLRKNVAVVARFFAQAVDGLPSTNPTPAARQTAGHCLHRFGADRIGVDIERVRRRKLG